MKTLSDFISDKDFDYSLNEIFHYSYGIQQDGARPLNIANAMLICAMSIMNYDDPWDVKNDFAEDGQRSKFLRFHNFLDYLSEHTQKRSALIEEGDRYLETKMVVYKKYAGMTSMFEQGRRAAEEVDAEDILELLTELQDELLLQGIPRLSLAKAFVDTAFVYAHIDEKGIYKTFCQMVIDTLDNEGSYGNELREAFQMIETSSENTSYSTESGATIH